LKSVLLEAIVLDKPGVSHPDAVEPSGVANG